MVSAHHQQLTAWEKDRQKLIHFEKRNTKLEGMKFVNKKKDHFLWLIMLMLHKSSFLDSTKPRANNQIKKLSTSWSSGSYIWNRGNHSTWSLEGKRTRKIKQKEYKAVYFLLVSKLKLRLFKIYFKILLTVTIWSVLIDSRDTKTQRATSIAYSSLQTAAKQSIEQRIDFRKYSISTWSGTKSCGSILGTSTWLTGEVVWNSGVLVSFHGIWNLIWNLSWWFGGFLKLHVISALLLKSFVEKFFTRFDLN